MLRLIVALTLLSLPSLADVYSYFYTCDSRVVDCSAFPKHYYGDFGLSHPATWQVGDPMPFDPRFDSMQVTESNVLGEVLGVLSTEVGNFGVWGRNNFLVATAPSADPPGGVYAKPVDINNNGWYLFNANFSQILPSPVVYLGVGAEADLLVNFLDVPGIAYQLGVATYCSVAEQQFGCAASSFWIPSAKGINDLNQILLTVDGVDPAGDSFQEQGVLSITPVPEPSPLLLLLSAFVSYSTVHFRRRDFHATFNLPNPWSRLRMALALSSICSRCVIRRG